VAHSATRLISEGPWTKNIIIKNTRHRDNLKIHVIIKSTYKEGYEILPERVRV